MTCTIPSSGPYWCQAPKQTLVTDTGQTPARATVWMHTGSCPCPQHRRHWALPEGKFWFLPVRTKTTPAKATRFCFLEDNCMRTRIVLMNSPKKEFPKQKFQYDEAQRGAGAVPKIRLWRLWSHCLDCISVLLANPATLARTQASLCFDFLTCSCED